MPSNQLSPRELLQSSIATIPQDVAGKSTERLITTLREIIELLSQDPCADLATSWETVVYDPSVLEPHTIMLGPVKDKTAFMITNLRDHINPDLGERFNPLADTFLRLVSGINTDIKIGDDKGCDNVELINLLNEYLTLRANIEYQRYFAENPPLLPDAWVELAFTLGAVFAIFSIILIPVGLAIGPITLFAVVTIDAAGMAAVSTTLTIIGAGASTYNGTIRVLAGDSRRAIVDYANAAMGFLLPAIEANIGVHLKNLFRVSPTKMGQFMTTLTEKLTAIIANALGVATTGSRSPINGYEFYQQGMNQFSAGQYESAIQSFNQAYALVPELLNVDLLFFRGRSFQFLGRYEEAANDFEFILASTLTPEIAGILANDIYCAGMEDKDKAIQVYMKLLNNTSLSLPVIDAIRTQLLKLQTSGC